MMTAPGISVAVVDDDDAKRYAIVRLLRNQGFTIVEGKTGAEALTLAQDHPDLMVLDVKLPDMSGFDVCRQLKADSATARILVMHMSATLVESKNRVAGLDAGADAYLTDAVHPNEFVATVRALLRARNAERALHQVERRFETLVRSVEEYAIFICDARGVITSWNEGGERIFREPRQHFLDRSYSQVITSPSGEENDLERARNDRHVEFERWQSRADGSQFFASGSVTPIRNDAGAVVDFVVIIRDMTLNRTREDENAAILAYEKEALRQAERASQIKDEFLATLSHELRTPLSAILGWTQLLRMQRVPPEQLDEGIAVIERNAKTQAQLIEDLLDVSRIISGKLSLALEQVDPATLVGDVIESLRIVAETKRVEIAESIEPEVGRTLGDPARLQQIVWNLLSNAIKFTPEEGRVQIEVTGHGGMVEICVADSGQGIDPRFLPFVFDRFRQADASSTRSHAGLGLGLAIVRHLAELHGGTVAAESAGIGKGAKFRVRLPRYVADPSKKAPAKGATPEIITRSDAQPDLSGLRILIVEDDRDGRELLRRTFALCKADVVTADCAATGYRLFVDARPNVLISDIGMPEEDGYSLIRRIREYEAESQIPPTPAVALTAFAQSEDRRRALRSGFQMHVAKPVVMSELLTVVSDLCGRISG